MAQMTLTDALNDLRSAEQALHRFEQQYWLSSDVFYELYTQGKLDNGEHLEEFAEWIGHYRMKLKREKALKHFSRQRIEQLQQEAEGGMIHLLPQEPVLEVA